MVPINPNLEVLSQLRLDFIRGKSMYETINNYCKEHTNTLSNELALLLIAHHQCRPMYDFGQNKWSERQVVLNLIWRGLKGEPIYENIILLEEEIERSSMNQIESFIERLPIKVLLIVIVFHLPALGILGITPLINQIKEVLQ